MTEKFTVFDALTEVRRQMPAIQKNHNAPASQGGYAFAGIESYLAHANPLMDAVGLHVIPHHIIESRYQERPTRGGGIMHAAYIRVQYRIYGPAGDFIEGEAEGEAADSGDKSTPKAQTAARKAFLKEMLRITSEGDDADAGDPAPTVRQTNGDTPDVPWVVQLGWARADADDATLVAAVADHDLKRTDILARVKALEPEARITFKEWLDKNDLSLAGAISADAAKLMLTRLPTESPQTPPAAQDGPAPAEAGQPLPGEYPEAPEGIDHDRWTGALAIADSMRLSEILASLAEHGLGTKGTEAERRIRLAVAIASEAPPD